MALAKSMGWVAAIQWRASSPTRAPGRSPHRSSRASATGAVGPGPAGGPEVLVQGVLDEGVGEVERPGHVGQLAHQGDGRGGVQQVEQRRPPCWSWPWPRGRDRSPGR